MSALEKTLVFKMKAGRKLPPERIEEYKRLLNEMLGIEGDWEITMNEDDDSLPTTKEDADGNAG